IGARIHSDHVVQVVAAGVDGESGLPWLAMELLQGASLDDVVASHGPYPLEQVLTILRQLCHALGAAHDAGIVHRDLNAENVFLAESLSAEWPYTVKILDFGIAHLASEARGAATDAMGSPLWMAPEQTVRGSAIGPAADVWALGLLAFYLLTGRSFW